jgi:dolichol-phosphate mannosyltransferase
MPPGPSQLDLSVVIPAYDEEGAIGHVLTSWDAALAVLGMRYEIRVYDDGSRDGTASVVTDVARARPAVVLVRQPNRGHGPTILRGYRESTGTWVFQVDGDDEMSPDAFATLWAAREEADLLLGYRVGRTQTLARTAISVVARAAVAALFGTGLRDVNVPFRLWRRDVLARLLPFVPPDAFAPNVILAGLTIRAGLRIREFPVPHEVRRTGVTSLGSLRMWRHAARSLAETIQVALRR